MELAIALVDISISLFHSYEARKQSKLLKKMNDKLENIDSRFDSIHRKVFPTFRTLEWYDTERTTEYYESKWKPIGTIVEAWRRFIKGPTYHLTPNGATYQGRNCGIIDLHEGTDWAKWKKIYIQRQKDIKKIKKIQRWWHIKKRAGTPFLEVCGT